MSDYIEQRSEMVRSQIIKRGISDERVIKAFLAVPRHEFVPEPLRNNSYDDNPLDIENGQTISQPYMVALMTDLLDLDPKSKVLEIGTGSGYQAAILSCLAGQVYTIERDSELATTAKKVLSNLGYKNIRFFEGDGTLGLPEFAPFDAIIVTAGSPKIPNSLLKQLNEDGCLLCPVGDHEIQRLLKVTYTNEEYRQETFGNCKFVPLVGKEGWKNRDD
jgi:protein-L-isoaspartate(D-aspartate) O-methyltransferase